MGFEIFQNSNNIKNTLVNNQGKTTPVAQNMQQMSVFEKKAPTVVVFDIHKGKAVAVDPYDDIPDISHGEAVASYIKTQYPDVNIEKRGKLTPTTDAEKEELLKESKTLLEKGSDEEKILFGEMSQYLVQNPDIIKKIDGFMTESEMKNGLKDLAGSLDKGVKFDAVNFSNESPVKIKDLAKVTGLPLTRENLDQYKDKVREWIKNNNSSSIKTVDESLKSIEKITNKGIPFYVAAGNEGSEYVNLFSFAKGVNTVGALDADGKTKTQYSADNSLVNKWGRSNFPVNKIKDQTGNIIGYDINGDNKPEISVKDTSGGEKGNIFDSSKYPDKIIPGTSFSTPTQLGKDLKAKFDNIWSK